MEEKKKKIMKNKNFLLLLIFSILLLYFLIYNAIVLHKNKKSHFLINFVMSDIKSFKIVNSKDNFLLKREGDIWNASSVSHIKMSKQSIDSFLDDLRHIKILRHIDEDQLSDYNFHPNTGPFIELFLIKNKKIKLVLGDSTVSREGVYLFYNHKVYIVPESIKKLFSKDLFDFRDTIIFDFVPANINYVKLNLNGQKVSLRKTTTTNVGTKWYVRYPFVKVIDETVVNTFLFELCDLKATKIIEGKSLNLEYFGVLSANYITLKTSEYKTYKAYVGKKIDKGYYFFLENRPNIMYIVDAYFVEHTLKDYIEKIKETKGYE